MNPYMVDNYYPSIIMASRVVSPASSGSLPQPTDPSQRSISHSLQPASTASTAVWLPLDITVQAGHWKYSGSVFVYTKNNAMILR